MRKIQISLPSTGADEWQATKESFETGWLTQGPKVAEFEKKFAARHQVAHALATTSCTTALHLILAAMEIGPGDEVIVPAFTWIATANVVLYTGATPVFVDVDRQTFNIDPEKLKDKLSEKTKAIIAVHLFGLCADMSRIQQIAPNIPIVEDAACATGASYRGQPAGSLGKAAAFSFHPRKSITTGEGGMLTTNDVDLAERANCLRNHGAAISEEQRHHGPRPYLLPEFNLLGFNYRMTDLQGAVGVAQLAKLDTFIEERNKWAEYYREKLAQIDWIVTPKVPDESNHAWQAYVCYIDTNKAPRSRNDLMEELQSKGISTRPGTHAVHMLGFYAKRFNIAVDDYPAARDCDRNTMAIPLHNRMSAEDYEYVVECLKSLS